MTSHVYSAVELQKMAELELQDQVCGAGVSANYLIAEINIPMVAEAIDHAVISGPPMTSIAANLILKSGAVPESDDEQYIENSDEYRDALGEGGGGVHENYGDGVGGGIDAISDFDGQNTSDILGFDDEDYMTQDPDTGYWEPDEEALGRWERRVLIRTNVLAALMIALTSQFEAKRIAEESFTGVSIEEPKFSAKEAFARKIGFFQKVARTAISKLFDLINSRNKKIYEGNMEKIKSSTEGSGNKTENYLTGGSKDIQATEDACRETIRYLNSTKRTLEGMQNVIRSMIQYLKDTMASDDFSTLGIINSLQKFNAKLDEQNQKVDEKLEDARAKLDEAQDAEASGWAGFIMIIFGGLLYFAIDAIVKNCGETAIDFGDGAEYMEDVDITGMIDDYRGTIVTLQNAYRGFLSLQLFQGDLRNVVREEFTGLSGIKNDAQILMQSAESTLGYSLQIFDATASQMMLKTQLHNSAVKYLKDAQQLRKAQPLRQLSLAISLAILVVSIVITCLTGGTGAPLIVVAIFAVIAIAKALIDAFAVDIASNVPGYHAADPRYFSDKPVGPGGTFLDELERLDAMEEANMAASARNQGVIGQAKDDYYYFDSQKFSTYEVKQKIFDNLIRMFFSLMKNARDMRRIAKAEFTGKSAADSGEALLQNAVENVILQRQLIFSAIKFQYSEVIASRNIDKQREIGHDKAWGNFGASLIGAIIGAFLGGIGGAAGALIGMSIGTSLFSTLYQLLENVFDHHWDMDINSPSRDELIRLLRAQSDRSTEGRLDAAELEAYQRILDQGIVSTGDGYHGINFGLVTQVYSQLGRIYAAKEALAKIRALRSQLRAIVKQEFSGVSTGTGGDLIQAVNQASFSTAMRIAGNLVKFLQEKVAVQNRARDAEKQLYLSIAMAAVNVALSVVGFVCAGVGNAVSMAIAGIVPGVMSLASSLASMIQALMTASSDLGHYNNYDAKTEVDKTGRRVNNAQNVDERLDQLEYEIMLEMNSGLVESLAGSYETVSPFASRLTSRVKGIYNVREALATVRSIVSAARNAAKAAMTGKQASEATFGKETIENYKEISLSMLDSLKQALDTICQRENKMNEAARSAFLGMLQTAISAISLAVSIVSASDKAELGSREEGQTSTTTPPAYSTPSPTTAPATPAVPAAPAPVAAPVVTAPPTTPPPPATVTPVSTTTPSETPAPAETAGDSEPRGSRTNEEIQEEIKTLGKVSAALSVANTVMSIINQVILDESSDANGKKAEEPQKGKGMEATRSSSKGKGDVFSSMSDMDAEIEDSSYWISVYQNHSEAAAILAQRYEKLTEQVVNSLVSISKQIDSFIDKKEAPAFSEPDLPATPSADTPAAPASTIIVQDLMDRPAGSVADLVGQLDSQQIRSAIDQLKQMNTEKAQDVLELLSENLQAPELQQLAGQAAAAVQPTQQTQPSAATFQPSETRTTPSTRALLDYADQIEAKIAALQQAESAPEAGPVPEASAFDQPVQDPQQVLANLRDQRDAVVAEKEGLAERLAGLQEDLPIVQQEVVDLQASADTEIASLREQETLISLQIDDLEAKPSLTPEEQLTLTDLRTQLPQIQTDRDMLEHAKGLLGQKVEDLQQEIGSIRDMIRGLNGDIQNLNKGIANLERQIRQSRDSAPQVLVAEAGGGGLASAMGFVKDLLGLGGRRAADDLDNVERQSDQPQAGAVSRGADETVVAVGAAGRGSAQYNPRHQYDESMRDLEILGRSMSEESESVAGVSASGYC